MGRDIFHQTRLLRAPSNMALNISRDGAIQGWNDLRGLILARPDPLGATQVFVGLKGVGDPSWDH